MGENSTITGLAPAINLASDLRPSIARATRLEF